MTFPDIRRRSILLALALAACTATDRDGGSAVIRDSAGIEIVEVDVTRAPAESGWRVIEPPLLQIGSAAGPREQQLYRVQGSVLLDDGTVVVADGGSAEVRWYSPDGAHVTSAGREGDGPGEFRSQTWIGRARGDSIYVWDSRLARLSVFGPSGRFARDLKPTLPEGTTWPTIHGSLADGRVLLSRGPTWFSDSGRIGVQRPVFSILVVSPKGVTLDSLGPFAGRAAYLRPGSERGSGVRQEVPFGPTTLIAAAGDEVYAGDNATYEIAVYSAGSTLRRIIRWSGRSRLAVLPEHIEAYRDERLAGTPPVASIREGMRALLEEVPSPEVMPAFRSMLTDSEGNLWVEESRAPGDDQPAWNVFDRDGRRLGEIRTPVGLTIVEIGGDYVLGRATDDLDVEYVRLHRLEKPD